MIEVGSIVKLPKRTDTLERMVRVGIALQQLEAECVKQFGFSRLQAGILRELHRKEGELFGPGTMRTDELAGALQCTSASISPALKELAASKLITLGRGKNRRERAIAITDEGRLSAEEIEAAYAALSARTFKGTLTACHEILDKLERRLPGVRLRRRRQSSPPPIKAKGGR